MVLFQRLAAASKTKDDSDPEKSGEAENEEKSEANVTPPSDNATSQERPQEPASSNERPMAKRSSRLARPVAPENFSQLRKMWEAKAAQDGC